MPVGPGPLTQKSSAGRAFNRETMSTRSQIDRLSAS